MFSQWWLSFFGSSFEVKVSLKYKGTFPASLHDTFIVSAFEKKTLTHGGR
jgi:hypothetical protein